MGRSFVFYPGNAECMTEEELNIEYISNSSYFYMANLDSVTKKADSNGKTKRKQNFLWMLTLIQMNCWMLFLG